MPPGSRGERESDLEYSGFSGFSGDDEEEEEELQGVTRKKLTATDLLVLTRLFGT